MSDYSAEGVAELFPYIFGDAAPGGAGGSKKEPGMPSAPSDPRNATMMDTMIVDVRWSWNTCAWLTQRHARAVILSACPWSDRDSAKMLDLSPSAYAELKQDGFHEMANWLNATPDQRESRTVEW